MGIIKKAIYACVGLAVISTDKLQHIVNDLVETGQDYENERNEKREENGEPPVSILEDLAGDSKDLETKFSEFLNAALSKLNLAKLDDYKKLDRRLATLEVKLDEIIKENHQVDDERM